DRVDLAADEFCRRHRRGRGGVELDDLPRDSEVPEAAAELFDGVGHGSLPAAMSFAGYRPRGGGEGTPHHHRAPPCHPQGISAPAAVVSAHRSAVGWERTRAVHPDRSATGETGPA